MISPASLSALAIPAARDTGLRNAGVRMADAVSRISPGLAASASSGVQRPAASGSPALSAPANPRATRGSLLDLSV